MSDMPDYFALLGLPEAYHLDAAQLRAQFLRLSRQHHPDFHTQADANTQSKALEASALLNRAYKALLKPDDRLTYLLQRYGLLGPDGGNLTDVQPSPAFLMDMMDLNEQADDLAHAGPDSRADVARQLEGLLAANTAQLESLLQGFDAAPATDRAETLRPVVQHYLERKYLLRLQEKLATFTSPH